MIASEFSYGERYFAVLIPDSEVEDYLSQQIRKPSSTLPWRAKELEAQIKASKLTQEVKDNLLLNLSIYSTRRD